MDYKINIDNKLAKEILEDFKLYLDENYKTNEEDNTGKAYMSDMVQFYKYFWKEYEEVPEKITRAYVNDYKKYMIQDRSLKFSTINRKLASLSIFENHLIEIKKQEEKAIREKDFYKIIVPYITSSMLPEKTVKKVALKAANNNVRDYLIILLGYKGGLRVSEIINIELERDIKLDMRTIVIIGKGNKVREMIITNDIYDALTEYLEYRKKILNGRKNKYLIISNKSANTGKNIDRTLINKMLNKYSELLKEEEEKIHPHILRHLFATEKYDNGFSDIMIKKALGDSSNASDRYCHPGNELNRAKNNRE